MENKEIIEEIIEDFSALNYLIDYYFPKRKLAIEVDELGDKDRDQTKENERQKNLKEYLDCEFIRINPDEKDFSAYDELGKVQKFIDKSQEKQNKRSQKRNKRTQKGNKRTKRRNKRIQRRNKGRQRRNKRTKRKK